MVEAHLNGVRNAIAAGWNILETGGSALDAVEEAVVIMEDDEAFDAGRGSFLNREGKVQLDALIMDGATLRAGGLGCVERIANPVRAARKVLSESPHVYFVGEGAERFAQEHGIQLCRNEDLIIPREMDRLRKLQSSITEKQDLFAPTISHDTVGAVALGSSGNIAAATSTGGTLNKAPGRLGDSSLIGCGCYADNQSAAVSTTGWGEPIMKLVLAKWAADRVASGNVPAWVAAEAMNYLKDRVNATAELFCSMLKAGSDWRTTLREWLGRSKPAKNWSSLSSESRSVGPGSGLFPLNRVSHSWLAFRPLSDVKTSETFASTKLSRFTTSGRPRSRAGEFSRRRNSMRIPRICSLLLVSAFSLTAFGQGVATGDLHVTVKDPGGNLLTNATVTVRDEAKAVERPAAGNGQGEYSVLALPPGSYSVRVTASGFANATAEGVIITVGGMADLPVTLGVAGGSEKVEVSAIADLIETTRTSTTDTVDQRRIDNLPINGRNYINFTLTDSQVVRDNAPNTGAAPTSGLNMSGQRGRSNLVNVDGADATDNSINGVRSTVSQEAVQEFQIITNNYAAEYGRASGGVVNIVTRSGANDFHGDVFGYLRNRSFQAVNPFSTVKDPAYTRVQAGVAFGGALKKDKAFYYFAYEITRRHETGFSSIGANNFELVPFDTATTAGGFVPFPLGTIQATPAQASYLQGLTLAQVGTFGVSNLLTYEEIVGASSGMAVNGKWPASMGGLPGFITSCTTPGTCFVPLSYQTLASQEGNYPVFEGTSLYSLRLDHNLNSNHRLTLRANVSPSTVDGIEVNGEDQPFGQNAYSRTSEQTYRDVAGVAQETWIIGNNKVNDFRFQYARRGLSYFYNTAIPGGSDPAINIPGFANFGREPYSYIQRTEQRYQFSDNLSWTIGRHNTKLGADFNYIPLKAIFTVNYGGVYDFGSVSSSNLDSSFCPDPNDPASCLPGLSPVQAYGAGLPAVYVQGLGSPSDKFNNFPVGFFWQDSWRIDPKITLNYGLRYDVEIAPKFKPPQGLALPAYDLLGLQKGIQTDKNNIQPRIGLAFDPKGDGKTVFRASYGMFYDHPLLGLYFLGDASDGSSSGQLAFAGTGGCSGAGAPSNLNAIPIFQGIQTQSPCTPSPFPQANANLGYLPNEQRFQALNFPQSVFLSQNYLNLDLANPGNSTFLPLGFQPFGYPQAKNFVYAYAQQANFSVERDLGHGYALNLAYNFNGGRHLNRPINANTVRGDLLTENFLAALADGQSFASPFTVSGCNPPGGPNGPFPYVDAALTNFFRPSGLNPSVAVGRYLIGDAACVAQASALLGTFPGFNSNCNPVPPVPDYTGCVPFGDMDANFSNGSSIYHGFSANLRKRFSTRYEFLASYTWSHAIDDSTDLQSTLTPQDSYFPGLDRANSTFDQRHRFVFSGVYQTGRLSGNGFASKFLSDWTFAPLIEFASGRPFNIITGNGDNFQLSSLTGRPNTFVNPGCTALGNLPVNSKYSPTGVFQEPCIAGFNGTLLSLDGNLGRNAGTSPWTVFDDLRVAKRVPIGERINLELIADMFNIANRYNVAAVSPLFTNAGQAAAAYDPRQFQFGMKVKW